MDLFLISTLLNFKTYKHAEVISVLSVLFLEINSANKPANYIRKLNKCLEKSKK